MYTSSLSEIDGGDVWGEHDGSGRRGGSASVHGRSNRSKGLPPLWGLSDASGGMDLILLAQEVVVIGPATWGWSADTPR